MTSAYAPIYMADARPTISYNTISHSADAAMSADPDSFQESIVRVEPRTRPRRARCTRRTTRASGRTFHGNHLADNSVNGLFVRIRVSQDGSSLDTLNVAGRFDDADIAYIIPQNLIVTSSPGGAAEVLGTCKLAASQTCGRNARSSPWRPTTR